MSQAPVLLYATNSADFPSRLSWYKKIIYHTNHSNVELALLNRKNVQQTVRLLLAKAFEHSNPDLTLVFNELYRECPSLFEQVLPRSEVADYVNLLEEGFDDDELKLKLPEDSTQYRPAAITCIQPKYAKDTLQLPTRPSQMSDNFRKLYTKAFKDDYGMTDIVEFGKAVVRWSKKVAFDDRYVRYFLLPGAAISCSTSLLWKR